MPTQPEGPDHHEDHAARLQPRDLLAAIALLTALPLPQPKHESQAFGRATLFFPLVGLLIGAILAGFDWLIVGRLGSWVSAIVVVAAWEAIIGRSANGPGRNPVTALAVLTKIAGLAEAVAARPAALLFAPMLARWCMVVLATGARHADVPGRKFNPAITFREFALTSVFTLAVVFSIAEAFGIFVVVCVAGVALLVRLLAHRWAGGVTWGFLLTSMQAIEAVVVVLCGAL